MAGREHNYRVDVNGIAVWTDAGPAIRVSNTDRREQYTMTIEDSEVESLIRALDAYYRLRFGVGLINDE